MNKTESRILVLDGYRALAILAVMAFHYTVRWAPPRDPLAHLPAGAMFADIWPLYFGWAGVEFFFVISGFVILMTLEKSKSVADFLVRRFARIWPALIVAAILTTSVVLVLGPRDWQANATDFIDSILLVGPNVITKLLHYPVKYVDGVYWSLWVELRFYALIVVFYYAGAQRFLAWWMCFQVIAFIISLVWPSNASDFLLLPKFLPYFTFGICIYKLYGNAQRGLAAAGLVLASAAILFNALSGNFDSGTQHASTEGDRLTFAGINLVIFLLFALFLVGSRWVSIFASRPAVGLGQASYSFYLLHQYIGVTIIRTGTGAGIPYLVMLPATIAMMIGLALLLYQVVEVPAKRAISAAWTQRAQFLPS